MLSSFNTKDYNGDMTSLMHHLSMQDPADVEALLSAVSGSKDPAGTEDKIANFDFTKAPVRKNSFWVIQLSAMGFQGIDEKDYRDEYFPGSTPVFSIIICTYHHCAVPTSSKCDCREAKSHQPTDDDREQFLVQEMAPPGMPSSDFLLRYIMLQIL